MYDIVISHSGMDSNNNSSFVYHILVYPRHNIIRGTEMGHKELVETIKDYISTQVFPVAMDRPFDEVMQYEAETLANIIDEDYLLIPRIKKEAQRNA